MTLERHESTAATQDALGQVGIADSLELAGDRYKFIGIIGRGGMGVVLRVLDTSFQRMLAIKVLRTDHGHSPVAERRFLDEARITGVLQHPGIPPVHEVGRLADGRPFFSMKLIDGKTLAALLGERPNLQTGLMPYLKIFEQIAQTVAYAHSQGVIHRDLKPSNIMVGAFGEVQVMDWGLAKRLTGAVPAAVDSSPSAGHQAIRVDQTQTVNSDSTDTNTQAGEVLGTYAYMPPEQARGEIQTLDERCDVFGLGAVLCTILTGKPPYEGTSDEERLLATQSADLGRAWSRLESCGADAELIALAKSCLAPKADDRPRNAGQVAAEMTRYLASVQDQLQHMRIQQAEAEVKAAEETKRRRLAVFLAAAIVVLVVTASFFGLWYIDEQAQRDRDRAAHDAEVAVRSAHLDKEVAAALDEAGRIRGDLHQRLRDRRQAAQLLSELHEWQTRLDTAHAAWKRADTLGRSGPEFLAAQLHQRLAVVADQLRADEKERQIAFALDQARLDASVLVKGTIRLSAAGPKLRDIFLEAGFAIDKEDPAAAAARLRQSAIRPALVAGLDFWALATDDRALQARLFEIARLADPDPWRDRFRQVETWHDADKMKALADAVEFGEQSPQVVAAVAQRLSELRGGDPELARRALVAHPRDFWLLFHLGMNSPNPVEQAGAFRAALAVRPKTAVVYYNLGHVQQFQRKLAEAAACYRMAIELNPASEGAYTNLGLVLTDLGKPEEARACYRKILDMNPGNVGALINLGASLHADGKFDDAIDCYRKASKFDPRNTAVLNNLGSALREKGSLDEAADAFRRSLEVDGKNPFAWCNLGHVLNVQGKFEEALKAMQRGHELGSRQTGWNFPSAIWVFQTQNRVAIDKKLTEVLQGKISPGDGYEQATMAEFCFKHRKRYVAAVRFYSAAFAAKPGIAKDLEAGHRYHAACAAVLVADGQGLDAKDRPGEPAASRRQALDWLRADLEARRAEFERKPTSGPALAQVLQQWQSDPSLATVREEGPLAKLPPDEQSAWRSFWTEVASLQASAKTGVAR